MVNTRTDADLSATVQNALQTLLPQIRTKIREEFRTSFGPSDAGGNPTPTTIHTWLERFNKQKPYSFEKATAPINAENWISHMEKIFDVMGCEDAFKTRLAVYKFEGNALAWWKAYKQAKGGDAWLVTHFLRLAGFLGAAAGTEEEQAKNFGALQIEQDFDPWARIAKVLAIDSTTLAFPNEPVYMGTVLQVPYRGLSRFKVQLVGLVESLASLLERLPGNPTRLARPQVASHSTCLLPSFR
nr:hypothetical protein [Tanacetum cinerariifolium]